MRRITRTTLVLCLALGLLAACGDDDGGEVVAGGDGSSTTLDPGTAVTSPSPTTDDGTQPTTWARIEPTADLENPMVATPDSIVPDPDDPEAVLVRFYGGVPECYGARATVVGETDTEVRIRLEVGGRPDLDEDVACIEIAEAQELRVRLAGPVAGRTLTAATR